ncbi:MAG: T9SS type A sorting domain-containing protein [Saprospiraceae bacterium]|nr:T9SS type A sorting domain-containing protein [Saprospiraceae bacterium]
MRSSNYIVPIFIVLILFFFRNTLTAQNFEYALSQKEFQESSIKTINITGNKVILGGGVGSCMSPAIWIFDTSGHYLSFQKLEVPYEYGFINDIRYDSTNEQFYMVAPVLVADDVGGASTVAFSFDSDLNLLQAKDLFPELGSGSIAKYQSHYLLTERQDSIIILDKKFEEIHGIGYVSNQYYTRDAWLVDSTLVIFQNSISSDARILLYNWDNQIIGNTIISNTSKVFLLKQRLFTLGSDSILRKYSFPEIQLLDSTYLPNPGRLEGGNTHENTFEIISYLNKQAVVEIYDTNLNVVYSLSSGLTGELELQGLPSGQNYYHTGRYHDYQFDSSFYPNVYAVIPYLRKVNPIDQSIPRDHISITHISLKNDLHPISIQTAQNGRTTYRYDSRDPLISEISVRNTTSDTLYNFVIYKDIQGEINCALYNGYHYVENIKLPPGDTIQILDSIYVNYIIADRGLYYYTAAPNHMLSDSSNYPYVLADISTSIHQKNLPNKIRLYPNPASDILTLDLGERYGSTLQLEIFSITGQKISQIRVKTNQIDIQHLSPGIYYVRLIERDKIFLGAFIKTE